MNVKNVEKKENSVVNFTVEIDSAEFETAVNRAYIKNKKSIYVPGFRKGKAPRMVIEGYYGAEVFHDDALELLYPIAYEMGLNDDSFEAVGRPTITDVNIAEDKTVSIVFETGVYPEVKLGQYRGLEAVKTVEPVTDEEIDADVSRMREKNARIVDVERPVKDGDITVIDFEGFLEGVPFEGGKGDDFELEIGSGQFVPGFEEQVVGMSIGEEKDLDITFPVHYAEDLAGKAVVFKVKLKGVKEKQLPELDDEFAKDVSEFDSLAELKADARTRLETGRKAAAERNFREALLTKAIENMEAVIPQGMIEEKVDLAMDNYSQSMAQMGMTLEQYAQMVGLDVNGLRAQMIPDATRQLQMEILFRAVSEAENFDIADEDIEKEYNQLAEQYQMEVDKVKEIIPVENIKKELGLLKASDAIYESGVAVDAPAEDAAE